MRHTYLNYTIFVALSMAVSIFSWGCSPRGGAMAPPVSSIAPTELPDLGVNMEPEGPKDGSLFSEDRGATLVADFRARHVGDVVTIILQENMKGAKDVKTSTSKQSDFNLGLSGIFGFDFKKRMEPRYPKETIDPSKALGGTVKDSFDGSGKTSRDASLTGTVSARVVNVLPGGNLLIRGTRALKINNETQYLTITGVVRPTDIGPSNTVSSTKIAEARIEYTGAGVLAEKQRPGWLSRVLGIISPF